MLTLSHSYTTFVTGLAFASARWKYYFLFIAWDTFEFICIYFFFVETKNRTLEELTEIFQAKSPVKASLKTTEVVVLGGEGVVAVGEELPQRRSIVRRKRRESDRQQKHGGIAESVREVQP